MLCGACFTLQAYSTAQEAFLPPPCPGANPFPQERPRKFPTSLKHLLIRVLKKWQVKLSEMKLAAFPWEPKPEGCRTTSLSRSSGPDPEYHELYSGDPESTFTQCECAVSTKRFAERCPGQD